MVANGRSGSGMRAVTQRQRSPATGTPRRPPVAEVVIAIDRASDLPVYRQIEQAVMTGIRSGRLRAGLRLPPERTLAEQLGVDRTTVVAAYRNLAGEGWVAPLVGRGTVITGDPAQPVGTHPSGEAGTVFAWDEVLTPQPDDDLILEDIEAASMRPGTLSLASGVPAAEGYPIAEFRSLLGDALRQSGEALLQYAPAEGLPVLRDEIARMMRRRGADVGDDGVLICAGSQQGLYLLARAMVVPGDTVAVEAPTYLGAVSVFRAADAHVVPLPRDRDGVDTLRLEALLARRQVKLMYLLPTFQNPTGETLGLARRRQVLAVAARYGVPIIEDDPYGELRYDGEALPSMFQLAGPDGGVAYLSTFSKVLFPGFRVGWVAGSGALIERLRREKALVDLDSNAVVQAAVAQYLALGLLEDHLTTVRPVYRARRDALIEGLNHGGTVPAIWHLPEGGFSLWVELESGLRARDVLREAMIRGVTFVPGDIFHVDGGGRSAMRLSFPALSPGDLREAGRRLADAIRIEAGRRSSRTRLASSRIV